LIIHNAVIHDWAEIGKWAVVEEGAVVKNKQKIPNKSIAVGIPVKIISETSIEYEKQWTNYKKIYSDLARKRIPNSLIKVD